MCDMFETRNQDQIHWGDKQIRKERIKEHLDGLRRCMEPPDESLDDTNPLLKHQWVHHQGQQPEFWAKVLTKHFTAFSRQVREGVIINNGEPLDLRGDEQISL